MPGQRQSIPPEVYDREYFLSEICEGWDEFREERGVSYNKRKQVESIGPGPGLRVLDAGCGRGEVLLACARAGAAVAGIDYSQTAVDLTRETLAEFPDADIRQGDVTALPWPDATFDRILFSDVIEHLDPPQTVPALAEFHRVLKPGGFVLVHTAPNRLFMTVGWPVIRPVVRLIGHRAIADKVDHWFRIAEDYHVNEQSIGSMRRALKAAGFARPKVWVDPDVLRSGQYHLLDGFDSAPVRAAKRVAALRPVRMFLGNDVFGLAHK
jgi:ubiquinone/menaquinone biosynthesis C-methylase UbiE